MENEVLQIGVVRRAHGVRGQVRVQLHDPRSSALSGASRVQLAPEAGGLAAARSFPIVSSQDLGGGFYLLSLQGVSDRDAADALRGLCLYARRAELAPLSEDEFYVADLVGCAVLAHGEVIGTVADVPVMAGQDMLVVSRPGRQDALVPLVAEMLVSVDLGARRVEIDPPAGLLDLDLAGA